MTFLKHIKFFFFLLLLYSCGKDEIKTINTPSENIFSGEVNLIKTLGGSKNDIGNSVINTIDGGYIILGFTDSNDSNLSTKTTTDSDFFLLKYNSKDILEWSKTYGGSNDDRGFDVIETSDNGYAVFGFSKSDDLDASNNEGNSDLWILKITSTGDITWEKSFGFSGIDTGYSLIQTSDNGFLIVGELDVTSSGGLGKSISTNEHAGGDYWAIKLDINGNKKWSNFFGGNFTETPNEVIETKDGDFILAGLSDSSDVDISDNKGSYDFWIVKINNKGNLIWEKSFGGTQIDEAFGIIKTTDGNFVIVGNTRSNDNDVTINNGGADLWVLKISSLGSLIWEKTFGGSSFDVGTAIHQSKNGDLIMSGNSRSSNNGFINKGENDAWILSISSDGNKKWEQFIGGSSIELLHSITELQDGSIIAVGESTSNDLDISENKGFSDLLIIKIK